MSHAAKISKQMLLHTVLASLRECFLSLSLYLFHLYLKLPVVFHNIVFSTTLTGLKINEAVIVSVEFVIYFVNVSPVTFLVNAFFSGTFLHT